MRNIVTSGLFFCALHALAAEPGQPLPFERGRWALSGGAKIETYLGRSSLRLRTGEAIAADVHFKDGTIEFDMAVGTRRSWCRSVSALTPACRDNSPDRNPSTRFRTAMPRNVDSRTDSRVKPSRSPDPAAARDRDRIAAGLMRLHQALRLERRGDFRMDFSRPPAFDGP